MKLVSSLEKLLRTMPDHFIRPTAHDLAYRKHVLESDLSLRLLNIGSGAHTLLSRPNVINLDIVMAPGVHVLGDAQALPFKDGSFDGVICRAVLEHLPYPSRASNEMFRVLSDEGFLLATSPFIYPYHAHPEDYQRFTASGLRVLFEDFQEIECGIGRLPTAALLSILEAYTSIFSNSRVVSGFVRWIVAWSLNPLKYLDHALKKKGKVGLLSSYYFLGRKSAQHTNARPCA